MESRFANNLEVLRQIHRARASLEEASRRHRSEAHQALRKAKDRARREIVRAIYAAKGMGVGLSELAELVGIPLRTIQSWRKKFFPKEASRASRKLTNTEELAERSTIVALPGRRLKPASPSAKRELARRIRTAAAKVSVRALREDFPRIATREIEESLDSYRRGLRAHRRRQLKTLVWTETGSVWAADHAKAPAKDNEEAPMIFAVRDLASGKQIAWNFVADEKAETTVSFLEEVFAREGKPLVLKLDNGPGFASEEMATYLERRGVSLLASPIRSPSFNGAIERAVGVLKKDTQRAANTGDWRPEDLDRARQRNDERRALQPSQTKETRAEAWDAREPIPKRERTAFLAEVRKVELELEKSEGYPRSQNPTRAEQATLRRRAITSVLLARNLLQLRSRNRKPITSEERARNGQG